MDYDALAKQFGGSATMTPPATPVTPVASASSSGTDKYDELAKSFGGSLSTESSPSPSGGGFLANTGIGKTLTDITNSVMAGRGADMYNEAHTQWNDILNKVNDKIKTDKLAGKDTSHLEQVRADHIASEPKFDSYTGIDPASMNSTLNKTTGQFIGEGLGAGVDVAGLADGLGALGDIAGLGAEAGTALPEVSAMKTGELAKPTTEAFNTAADNKILSKVSGIAQKTPVQKIIGGVKNSLPFGYGYDVAGNLQNGETTDGGILKPGAGTLLSFLAPPAIEGVSTVLGKGTSAIARAWNKSNPSPELVQKEQTALQSDLQKFFDSKKTTMNKDEYHKAYGQAPAAQIAEHGLVPDIIGNKISTKGDGQAVDQATDLISHQAQGIQSLTDSFSAKFPNEGMTPAEINAEATAAAEKKFLPGTKLKSVKNAINAETDAMGEGYDGKNLTASDMNKKRVEMNDASKAWKTDEFRADSSSIIGDVMRNGIDRTMNDPAVREVNKKIGQIIVARDMLSKIHGDTVKGGELSKWFATMLGAMVGRGAEGGGLPFGIGPFLGGMGARRLMETLQSNAFGGETRKTILSFLAKNTDVTDSLLAREPEIIKNKFNAMLKDAQDKLASTPQLPAPSAPESSFPEAVTKLQSKIAELKASGQDTTSLENALKIMQKNPVTGPTTEMPANIAGATADAEKIATSQKNIATPPAGQGVPDIQMGAPAPKSPVSTGLPTVSHETPPNVYSPESQNAPNPLIQSLMDAMSKVGTKTSGGAKLASTVASGDMVELAGMPAGTQFKVTKSFGNSVTIKIGNNEVTIPKSAVKHLNKSNGVDALKNILGLK